VTTTGSAADDRRPIVIALCDAAGLLTDVESQQVVGSMLGLPIVTDPNITTTAGTESPTGTSPTWREAAICCSTRAV
jgi:hypothetical protein